MNPQKTCSLCHQPILRREKLFGDEGQWSHEECIKTKLRALKKSGVNPEVIDFILARFGTGKDKKSKKGLGFFRRG